MPYSQKWRDHRREIHQYFNQREVPRFEPIQIRECRAFLSRVLESPDQLGQHLRLYVMLILVIKMLNVHLIFIDSSRIFTAIILKIVYDMDIDNIKDDYVRQIGRAHV